MSEPVADGGGAEPVTLVYVTAPDAGQALRIGRLLVEEGLAACANVLPSMTSIYRWKGAVETADEAVLLLKTVASAMPAVVPRIRALHPYETPCILCLPVSGGDRRYLAWIGESVAPAARPGALG